MSDTTVLQTTGLGKCYRIRRRKDPAQGHGGRRTEAATHWALRGLDLEVPAGQVLGLVGPNGAGKSTLLRLLARTTAPSEGRFSVAGRVASMLDVGVGFSWELSGRENIYLSGTLLGMRRHEVRDRLDEIVEFAGISSYLDTPVKRYSSGMYVRLGFSVAAHLQADVLLVDEVLSVGDAAFRARCLAKMREDAAGGRTIVFVSHGLGSIQEFCDRALLLEAGRVRADGPPRDVVARYLHREDAPRFVAPEHPTSQVRLVEAMAEAGSAQVFDGAAPIHIAITFELKEHAPGCTLVAAIVGPEGPALFQTRSDDQGLPLPASAGVHRCTLELPPHHLTTGAYHVALALHGGAGEILWASDRTAGFEVRGAEPEPGGFPAGSARLYLPCRWS
jgi:lipopolysaccharide transport system ATP-binding protein